MATPLDKVVQPQQPEATESSKAGIHVRADATERTAPPSSGKPLQAWTFSSSGWLFAYSFGVVKCLRELEMTNNVYVIGSSGGACAGAFLFMDQNIDEVVEYIYECAARARSHWWNAFKIAQYVRGAIDRFISPECGPRMTGHMEISVTKLPWMRNVRIKEFADSAAVMTAVMASSRIVPLAGLPMHMPGVGWVLDGGVSDFQLIKGMLLGRSFFSLHTEDAVSVCPFYTSRADIKPSEYVPMWWALYPPSPDKLKHVYELGYKDAKAWIRAHGRERLGIMRRSSTGEGIEERPALFWQVLQETSEVAPSCHEELGELVFGIVSLMKLLLRCLAWFLICMELLFHSFTSAFYLMVWPVLTADSRSAAWKRFNSVSVASVSPWLLLKTIPAISPWIPTRRNSKFNKNLQQHSVCYRLFQYFL
ncbi:hypothetical protein WJX72_007180 [[Myrmecia] bisecta]|uniref:Patatin n=1 Tax=[Myrmecia] bisecta TaxID=41462 RepID=A0AAW1PGC5_9CHLO